VQYITQLMKFTYKAVVFVILKVVTLKIFVFWHMTQCNFVIRH
jgi:hypothetical protein